MGRHFGYTHKEETKQIMSELKKGIPFTEEHKRKLSESHKRYWLTHKLTEEQKKKRGRLISEAYKRKTVTVRKPVSEETRKKMSEARKAWAKAHPYTLEERIKRGMAISEGWRKRRMKVVQVKDSAKLPVKAEEGLKKVELKKVDRNAIREYVKKYGKIQLF